MNGDGVRCSPQNFLNSGREELLTTSKVESSTHFNIKGNCSLKNGEG